MNRIDRLQAILIQLQGKRIVKAQEIAERFGISLRTVYRDIRSLEEAGVPIAAEAGVGYSLMSHYQLPPVSFTHHEASALLFGEKLVEQMSDEAVRENFQSAIFKIKAILRPEEKEHLELLHNRIAVINHQSTHHQGHLHLTEIQHAMTSKKVVQIKYQSRNSEEPETRQVEPIGLCNYGSRWHMLAWCKLRADYRDFRLDRIQSLQLLDESFCGTKHPSMDELFQRMIHPKEQHNITLTIKEERRKFMVDTRHYYGFQQEEKLAGDNHRMYFFNNDLNGFAVWLLATGCMATIEQPIELKQIIARYVTESAKNYLK